MQFKCALTGAGISITQLFAGAGIPASGGENAIPLALLLSAFWTPLMGVTTSHWVQSNEADFKAGTLKNRGRHESGGRKIISRRNGDQGAGCKYHRG